MLELLHLDVKSRHSYKNSKSYMSVEERGVQEKIKCLKGLSFQKKKLNVGGREITLTTFFFIKNDLKKKGGPSDIKWQG